MQQVYNFSNEEGLTLVLCPFCFEIHRHEGLGFRVAHCSKDRVKAIDRYFKGTNPLVPMIIEYEVLDNSLMNTSFDKSQSHKWANFIRKQIDKIIERRTSVHRTEYRWVQANGNDPAILLMAFNVWKKQAEVFWIE